MCLRLLLINRICAENKEEEKFCYFKEMLYLCEVLCDKKSDKIPTFVLRKLADIPIVRHVKIKKDTNPFDSTWVAYFENRRKTRLKSSKVT